MPTVRAISQKPDHRENAAGKSVKQITAKPKGITPELKEPKRPAKSKSILGQSGSRKKGKTK